MKTWRGNVVHKVIRSGANVSMKLCLFGFGWCVTVPELQSPWSTHAGQWSSACVPVPITQRRRNILKLRALIVGEKWNRHQRGETTFFFSVERQRYFTLTLHYVRISSLIGRLQRQQPAVWFRFRWREGGGVISPARETHVNRALFRTSSPTVRATARTEQRRRRVRVHGFGSLSPRLVWGYYCVFLFGFSWKSF